LTNPLQPWPGKRYSAELQLVHGPQVYSAEAVEVRSDELIVEVAVALAPGATVSLMGDLHGLDLKMQLRTGAKVSHCRPCGQGCYQVVLQLAWSDLEVHRPGEPAELELDRRSAVRLH
jgi:hypothetical protein